MRHYIFSVLILLISIIVTSCNSDNDNIAPTDSSVMQDGEWEGSGEGRNGTIIVRIDVQNHIISSSRVVSQSESTFAQETINTLMEKTIGRSEPMSVEVDGITGATLTSTGVIDAVNMAMLTSQGKAASTEQEYADTECDVVIVGAGGAGLSAAVEAADQGAKIIVLEKQGILGGNTNYSTGGINASETSVQKGLGIADSNQQFYDDTMKGGHELNFPELVRSFVEHSASTIDWLIGLGADLSDIGLMGGSSVKRTHRPKGGTAIGSHLMKILKEATSNRNIDIRANNAVTGLIIENGAVVGVKIEQKNGNHYTVRARSTIIATGGFGANLEMVTHYKPSLTGFSTLNHPGATGDAFDWVKAAGGDLVHMNQIQIHPTAESTNHILITEAVRGNGAILINNRGLRFVNEMETRDVVSEAILAQEGGKAYLFFDMGVRKSLASIETYANQHLLIEGNTLTELAQKTGMDATQLEQTVTRYNDFQACGVDSDFGRSAIEMTAQLVSPPYYAISVSPAIHHTMGGIRVDADMHVLNADGSVISGLYAAGEVTGGLHGANRLGGNGVADVVINGKIAGRNAAQ